MRAAGDPGRFGSMATGSSRSKPGRARYAPKAETPSCREMPCGLMVTRMTSFPRSSLLKGGTVPLQEI
jgi:hypothetical protein